MEIMLEGLQLERCLIYQTMLFLVARLRERWRHYSQTMLSVGEFMTKI